MILFPSNAHLRIAGLALMLAGCGRGSSTDVAPKSAAPERLVSDSLPDPVVLSDGNRQYSVTRFELEIAPKLEFGTITLDESELRFDDLGDAVKTGGKPPTKWRVNFAKVQDLVFDLQFPDGHLKNRLRIALAGDPSREHRLIVQPVKDAEKRNPDRILLMHTPELIPDALGNGPQGDRFHFETLAHLPKQRRSPYVLIDIIGKLPSGGTIQFDANYRSFRPDGTVATQTALAFLPSPVSFRPLEVDQKTGRRVFEIVAKQDEEPKQTHLLVLAPDERGPHRIVIKENGRVQHVFPLKNVDRAEFLDSFRKLNSIPADEGAAISELRKQLGYRFRFEIEDGHVSSLRIWDGDLARLDRAIGQLPRLQWLSFSEVKLPPQGLPSLSRLKHLRDLDFYRCEIADGGLDTLKHVPQLETFQVSECTIFSSKIMERLAPLKKLTLLEIRNEKQRPNPPQIDDDLKWIVEMKNLYHLGLQGQLVSDAGLEHIAKLPQLRHLFVTSDGITDAGRNKLKGRLPGLKEFRVYPKVRVVSDDQN